MTHPKYEHCARCRRPAPAQDSSEFMDWEATEDGLPICPGCLTGLDEQHMDEDAMQTADDADRRTLCRVCFEQRYNTTVNASGKCMDCQGRDLMIEGASRDALPPHEVTEEGVNIVGQPYAKLRYTDGSEGLFEW